MPWSQSIATVCARLEVLPTTVVGCARAASINDVEKAMDGFFQQNTICRSGSGAMCRHRKRQPGRRQLTRFDIHRQILNLLKHIIISVLEAGTHELLGLVSRFFCRAIVSFCRAAPKPPLLMNTSWSPASSLLSNPDTRTS